MQQSVANFTTNNTTVSTDPNSVNGLGTYFNGLGWDQFYLPPDNNTTVGGAIQQINTPLGVPVTIITAPGGTAGLVDGRGRRHCDHRRDGADRDQRHLGHQQRHPRPRQQFRVGGNRRERHEVQRRQLCGG